MESYYEGKTALIVDSKLEDLTTLKAILAGLGLEDIHVASSVNMAAVMLEEDSYDFCFIVYDLGKDEKNGLQLLQESVATGRGRFSTTNILIVGDEQGSLLFGSLETSPDAYLSKPYDQAKVRHRLEKLVRLKRVVGPLLTLLDQQQWEKAEKASVAIRQRYPGLQQYLERLQGIILLETERYGEAVDLFQSIVQRKDQPWARVGLGVALQHSGRFREAAEQLEIVIEQQQISVEAYSALARIQLGMGEDEQAVMLLRKAVMLQPTVPQLQASLGDVAAMREDWGLALEAYRSAVRYSRYSVFQCPDYYLGWVRSLLDKVGGHSGADALLEAIRILEDLTRAFEADTAVLMRSRLLAAELYQMNGEGSKAKMMQRDALELYQKLPVEQQGEWLELLVDELADSDVIPDYAEYRQKMAKKMAAYRWGKQCLKGLVSYRSREFSQAYGCFVESVEAGGRNAMVSLNLAQAGIDLLNHNGSDQVIAGRCFNHLLELEYAGLGAAQRKRYKQLLSSLAATLSA